MIDLLAAPALDPDLAEAYLRDGFVKIPGALTPAEIDLLRSAVDRQLDTFGRSTSAYDFQDLARQVWGGDDRLDARGASRFDMTRLKSAIDADPAARPLFDEAEPGAPEGRFFYDAAGWRRHPEIRRVALDSALPELAAALLQSTYINFWEDTTFVKTPGATQRTAFHQDYTYFQISGRKCCIVWIPLDVVDAENGALEYVRGSHRWGEEFAPNLLISQTPTAASKAPRLPDIEGARDHYDIVRIDAAPGDVVVHDVMAVHGSAGNKSAHRTRRAVSFRYCGDDIRYQDKPGAIVQPWVRSPPADGAPLYSPDYPRVWPRPFPGAELSRLYDSPAAA